MISSIIYDAVGIIHHNNVHKRFPSFHVQQKQCSDSSKQSITSHHIHIVSHRHRHHTMAHIHLSYRWLHCFQIHTCITIYILCVCDEIYWTAISLTENQNMNIFSSLYSMYKLACTEYFNLK